MDAIRIKECLATMLLDDWLDGTINWVPTKLETNTIVLSSYTLLLQSFLIHKIRLEPNEALMFIKWYSITKKPITKQEKALVLKWLKIPQKIWRKILWTNINDVLNQANSYDFKASTATPRIVEILMLIIDYFATRLFLSNLNFLKVYEI